MTESALGAARIGLTAVQNLGFALLVGALLSDGWLKRTPSAWQAEVCRAVATVFRAAAVVAWCASALFFWVDSASMAETSLWRAWPAVRAMLRETTFGHAWAAGAGCMLAVVALSCVGWAGRARGRAAALWLALGGAALARSHGGHPVDAGAFSVPVWADWLHLLAISAWVGLVAVAAWLVMPKVIAAPSAERANGAAYVRALSNTATCALVVLVLSGAYNAWRSIGASANLLGTVYGKLLLLKLAFVAVAAALGGYNRMFAMPGLLTALWAPRSSGAPAGARFTRVLRVESMVLAAALLVAAVLVASPLPGTE